MQFVLKISLVMSIALFSCSGGSMGAKSGDQPGGFGEFIQNVLPGITVQQELGQIQQQAVAQNPNYAIQSTEVAFAEDELELTDEERDALNSITH